MDKYLRLDSILIQVKASLAIERLDERENYGERINLIGMCDRVLLHVSYTERGRIRLISARKAEKHERNDYYRENARGWDGG